MKLATKTLLTCTFAATACLGLAQDSQAALILTFVESGSDLSLTISGSVDPSGLGTAGKNTTVGANSIPNTGANPQILLGSGTSAGADAFNFSVANSVFNIPSGKTISVDSWTGNVSGFRFQQNNGQVLVDNPVVASPAVITVDSTHTFTSTSLADLGLTVGQTTVWFENPNVSGTDGQIIVSAVPEPGSLALLGLGGLLIARRRRA